MDLAERLSRLHGELRLHPEVRILAASKQVPSATLRQAHALGLRHFGENYFQEAVEKIPDLADLEGTVWHFIGRIQRNKTSGIARHFSWVESVGRLLVAERLDAARAGLPPLNVLLEVAVSGEGGKGGVSPEALPELARAVIRLPRLRLRGLMALVHPGQEQAEAGFVRMQELFRDLQERHPEAGIDTLSMGTSGDYALAVAHGATEIRLGTALFGARPKEGA